MADLRFARTEKMLQLAFLKLLESTPYHEISIAKLAQESLIDRTTFYAHYDNLAELAEELIRQELAPFHHALSTRQDLQQKQNFDNYSFFSHELLSHLLTDRQQITLLRELPLGSNSFDRQLRGIFTQTYAKILQVPASDFTVFLLDNWRSAIWISSSKTDVHPLKKSCKRHCKRWNNSSTSTG